MTRQQFEEYTGQDERIDRFIGVCQKYGLTLRYAIGEDTCTIDAYEPTTNSIVVMAPYLHTLTFDLANDTVTMLAGYDIEHGLQALESICDGWTGMEIRPGSFIDNMRTL